MRLPTNVSMQIVNNHTNTLPPNPLTQVISEVAGTVSLVAVALGQVVRAGDVLVVIESMKMEIPVEAPSAGTLVELRVEAQGKVVEGMVVAILRSAEAP